MRGKKQQTRFALTVLFSILAFGFLVLTMVVTGSVMVFMVRKGIVTLGGPRTVAERYMLNVAVWSVIVGLILATVISRFPLRPINSIINAMNRLASGDYKTRLHFGKGFGKYPTAVEVSNSFNNLAEELEKTEMLRSDFVNNFSHEFKTPIVSIAGFAKLLKRGNLTEEQKAEYIDIIEEESLRLSAMATNVLSLTKVENQTILTNITRFNLSEQLRNCVILLENKWMKKNIDLNLEFGEYYINANEELLKQVWINLIDNAIKFAYEATEVEISIKERETELSVSVANTGEAIPEEIRNRIFDKFYQGDSSHSAEGNGVGLAVVKAIVKLHSGSVQVESGERTVFTVAIPKERKG